MIDIVFPKGNEPEFISIAEKLGHLGLIFVYDKKKDLSELQKRTDLKLYSATNKKIIRNRGDARPILEKSKNIIIYNLEDQEKDFTKTRNSGLNEIFCEIAKKNNIIIGLSTASAIAARRKSIILGRMQQNAMLCRKKKVQMMIASFTDDPWKMRAKAESEALAREIGVRINYCFADDIIDDFFKM